MLLSRQSVEILLDLVEIKVSALQIHDRDDARELNKLRKCRQELVSEHKELTAKHQHRLLKPALFEQKPERRRYTSNY